MIVGNIDDKFMIFYKKIDGTISASSEANGYPAVSVNNELTYSYWQPQSVPAWLQIDFDAQIVDYAALGAHTLNGCSVSLEGITESGNVELGSVEVTDNNPLIFKFEPQNLIGVKINILSGQPAFIGVLFVGISLSIKEIYGGVTPITINRTTTKRTNESERGQWLGTSIIREGLLGDFSFQYLRANWVRENIVPFILWARTKPFFIAWRPLSFPNETAYCYAPKDLSADNSGQADFMNFNLSVKGLGIDE